MNQASVSPGILELVDLLLSIRINTAWGETVLHGSMCESKRLKEIDPARHTCTGNPIVVGLLGTLRQHRRNGITDKWRRMLECWQ